MSAAMLPAMPLSNSPSFIERFPLSGSARLCAGLIFGSVVYLALSPLPRPLTVLPIASHDEPSVTKRSLGPLARLLSGERLDVNRASLDELIALPEVGDGLARAIVAARTQKSLRCLADLESIPNLGYRRARRLLAFLQPLPVICGKVGQTR